MLENSSKSKEIRIPKAPKFSGGSVKFELGGKSAGKFIKEQRNQNFKSAKIFRRKVMTLQHSISQL